MVDSRIYPSYNYFMIKTAHTTFNFDLKLLEEEKLGTYLILAMNY